MGNSLGRWGRRRRVLNEEMVAASGTHAVPHSAAPAEQNGSSYSEAARTANHARLTDLVPRRTQTLCFGSLLSLIVVVGLIMLDVYRSTIASAIGLQTMPLLEVSSPGSLASWFSSLVLWNAAVVCVLIYSVRRHKLRDYRGRYRVWMWAAVASVCASCDAVTSWYGVGAETATRFLPWTAAGGHFVAWLLLTGIGAGWITIRVMADIWESGLARFAALVTCFFAAMSCSTVTGWTTHVGIDPRLPALIGPLLALLAQVGALLTVTAYARFVILDADGLLPSGSQNSKGSFARKPSSANNLTTNNAAAKSPTKSKRAQQTIKRKAIRQSDLPSVQAASVEWIDGTSPDDLDFDDGRTESSRNRNLSKSERKRLRKLKAQQRRAA